MYKSGFLMSLLLEGIMLIVVCLDIAKKVILMSLMEV